MKNTLDHRHEEILAYLNGSLAAAQKTAFEQELQENADLQAEKTFVENLQFSLKHAAEFQQFQQEMKQALRPQKAFFSFMMPKRWLAAASLLFVVGMAWWLLQAPTSEKIWAEYYVTELPTIKGISPVSATNSEDKKAFTFYQQKQYAQAIQVWDTLIFHVPDNHRFLLYQAKAYIATGQTIKAQQNLRTLCDNSYEEYQRAAHWEMALLFVKSQQNDSAAVHLRYLIEKQDSIYGEKAKEVLKKIKISNANRLCGGKKMLVLCAVFRQAQ